MPRKKSASTESAYSKVSATLETSVLEGIRERSPNVSEFLNEAAKRALYRERLREAIRQLRSEGYEEDLELQDRIRKALTRPKPTRSHK
jgi:hypothetical protein